MFNPDGNINMNMLTRELEEGLNADIKYRQTDNMKKRACKVASNYDEFRAMVQCAHLKTLSRKEIESLKSTEKGWNHRKPKNKVDDAIILSQEILGDGEKSQHKLNSSFSSKPKNGLEFEREWRRIENVAKKLEYVESLYL
jgi:hypothetical protein